MTPTETLEKTTTPLRVWPGVAAVAAIWIFWFGARAVLPENPIVGLAGAAAGLVGVLVWWLFFSRAPWLERIGILLLIIAAMAVTRTILHPSVRTSGMGNGFYIFSIPIVTLALAASAAIARRFSVPKRRATLAAAVVLACASFALLRTDGVTGDGDAQWAWRWAKTSEQRLLAQANESVPAAPAAAPAAAVAPPPEPAANPEKAAAETAPTPAPIRVDWSGFRGTNRDGRVPGLRIQTDWAASPPVEVWRREVGPAWSSFAIGGGLLYTQEQLGDHEIVSCYRLSNGEPVWRHRTAARHVDSEGGPGPRGTPTLAGGRVYALGGTGILNALDASTGALLWTRNAASDTGAKEPGWGFTGSPIVVNDLVVASVSGRLVAYDIGSGEPRWHGPKVGGSYSSPQLMTLGGVEQIVLLTGQGAVSVTPQDGKELWRHAWEGAPIVQPALSGDGGLLVATGDMMGAIGTRRVAVSQAGSAWKADEVWTSRGLKPYFNDLVVHRGHAYGFDGSILSCIDVKDGNRKWKGGRYGHGQMLLLPDQDLLLVLSEEGELVLVSATPDQFKEVAKAPALEGKTWNHPAIVRDTLLVRNGQHMAAFRLPRAN